MKDKRLEQILQDVEDFKLEYGDDYTLEEAEEWISLDDTYTNSERRYFLDCLSGVPIKGFSKTAEKVVARRKENIK